MEAKGCGQRWQTLPEFPPSRRCSDRQIDGRHRRVAVAPTSTYVMRKPLFSAEQYTSILKKTNTEKENHLDVSRPHNDRNIWTRPGLGDTSGLSASTEDLSSPLAVSELTASFSEGAKPAKEQSHFSGSRSAQRSLSRSTLGVQRLDPPLTSTVLYPTSRLGKAETKMYQNKPMGAYEWNYWACAIPTASPPSPNRHSPDWDPHREYQALLDYTYPLRPGQGVRAWGSSGLQEDLQDSGVELEHLRSSTSLSGLDFFVNGTVRSRERSLLAAGQRSPDLPRFSSSCRGGPNRCDFIRSTSVLPPARRVGGELDEEFWPLPEQLEEFQLLSTQVREVVAQLSRPVSASWTSLEPGSTSIPPEKPTDEEEEVSGDAGRSAAHLAAGHGSRTSGSRMEPVGGGGPRRGGEVEALAEWLHGISLPCGQQDSLLQHIQVFSSQLQQLIQQLHGVSESVELRGGVKASVAECQREASSRQPLTSCLLHTGRLLLTCIDTTSPLLRDALLLMERQSGAVSHAEHPAPAEQRGGICGVNALLLRTSCVRD